ncbi:MAG TPA: RNA methyltransferase [Deltaproteobacteria bacterium]|nr:RNA methyltransferase [Deltaproteobacteria bacterium]
MLHIGLVHWPCIDKNGKEIATAITNLDLHDCARVCLTYGIDKLYIVHPYQAQLDFAQKIVDHWLEGFGGEYNPIRKRAFEVIRLVRNTEEIKRQTGARMIGTSAAKTDSSISWSTMRSMTSEEDICVLFGTGWGIAPSLMKTLDGIIDPIEGAGDFNHLSVRSAVSIAIDRILGR